MRFDGGTNLTLSINPVRLEDTDTYRCVVTTTGPESVTQSQTFNLTVQSKQSANPYTRKPANYNYYSQNNYLFFIVLMLIIIQMCLSW